MLSVVAWKRCNGISNDITGTDMCGLVTVATEICVNFGSGNDLHYPEPVVFQWQSSGNTVCLELRPHCTLECHWRKIVSGQCASGGFPVVFQCVPIIQINTGSPLGHHWVLASASVVPVAFQCTCGSSGLPVCSNYAN